MSLLLQRMFVPEGKPLSGGMKMPTSDSVRTPTGAGRDSTAQLRTIATHGEPPIGAAFHQLPDRGVWAAGPLPLARVLHDSAALWGL